MLTFEFQYGLTAILFCAQPVIIQNQINGFTQLNDFLVVATDLKIGNAAGIWINQIIKHRAFEMDADRIDFITQ